MVNCRHRTVTLKDRHTCIPHQTDDKSENSSFKLVFSERYGRNLGYHIFSHCTRSIYTSFCFKTMCIRPKWNKLHWDVSLCVIYFMVCNTSIKFACGYSASSAMYVALLYTFTTTILVYGYDYDYSARVLMRNISARTQKVNKSRCYAV